jgi:hypothetical protein
MALTKRSTKGSALSYAEMDANFTHLGGDGSYEFPATDGTATHVLATDGNGQLSFVPQTVPDGVGIALTDLSVTTGSASGSGSLSYNSTTGAFTFAPPDLSTYLTTVAFSDLTGKPTTIAGYGITDAFDGAFGSLTATPTTISGYGITDAFDGAFSSLTGKPTTVSGYGITDAFDGATSSLTGDIDLTSQVTGILPVGNMAATALTTVQTAANESAQLALTTEEGDVVVRSDENKTYMHNGGSAGSMADYTLLATPTDSVTSVDGNTGVVTTLQLGTTATTALAGDTALLQLGTTSTTALAGDTSLLQLGTSSTTAMAGNTTFTFADITSKPTTISGYGITDALELGTSSTTALAGDTALLQLGTSSATALAGDTALLQLGTSSTTALAGDTALLQLGTSSTTALAGDTALLQLGTSSTTALAGDTVVDNLLLEVAKSDASLNTGDKSWIKVATVTIDTRYQYYSAQLAVVGTGAAEGVANEKVVAIRVKQQASLSNAPLVEVTTYNNSNEDYDFGHVVAVNTVSETRVDIYFRADGPNSGAEIYRMAETVTATVAWVTGFTANYVTSAPTNFVQGGVHEKWHSGNQAGIFGSTNGILKANGSGVLSAAVAGTDYSTLALGTTSTTALAGNTALSAIGGSLDLSSQVTGTLPVGNMAATALTTVQTAANQAAQLALTTEEGDVVVRTDENKTYMRNGGTADPHDMTDFTLLATPTDAVTSVDGNTGVVTTLQLGTTSTTALAGNTTSFGGSASTVTLGSSAGPQTINIQAETPASGQSHTINVGTGGSSGTTKTINIGTTTVSYHTKNINMGNSSTSSGTSSNITMYGTVLMDDATVASTHTIGGTTQTGAITIGRSTQTQTINIGTGAVASSKTKTINIGTGNSSGSTTNINIGPTNTSATRAIDINGNLTVDGTTQFDHMVTFKSDASTSGVYDQIVSFQAKGTSSAWYEAARIATLGAGSAPSRMIIGQDNAALTFFDGFGSRYVYPANSDTGAGTNGVCDLGSYGARFKLGRFSSGTTTSSDRNEKRDIEELTAAELRVAVRCKPLLRKYRRIDAYEEKGEAARIHFGIMAQDLDDAFTAEGLDAHRYAMFMEDTWYEYEGGVVTYPTLEDIAEEHRASATEHTAMGVRYEQLLAFMIAAL